MRRGICALSAATLLLALPGAAAADQIGVTVEFQAFAPQTLDALPGDAVTWENHSGRFHTVTADAGAFDSGTLFDGQRFTWTAGAPGVYSYHCQVHPGMLGEIDVRRVTLLPLPPGLVAVGQSVDLQGRTADPGTPVEIQQDTGSGFQTIATASAASTGAWQARIRATQTARLRAVSGQDVSETRRVLVVTRTVRIRATKRGIAVTVVPAAPYARVALQLHLRERFGWWPAATRRLDYLSQATFPVRGPVRARVALLGRDGWTALALSPVVRVPGR